MIQTMNEAIRIARDWCGDRHLPNQHTYKIAISEPITFSKYADVPTELEPVPYTELVMERKTLQWHVPTMDILQSVLPQIVVPLPEDLVSLLSVTLCEQDGVWAENKGSGLHTRLTQVEFGLESHGVESFSVAPGDQLVLNLTAPYPLRHKMSLRIEYYAVHPSCVTHPKPYGRRAAIMATREKRKINGQS